MIGARLAWGAVRSRPGQAVLVVLLSALVVASAVLGPLYLRATEQSVLRDLLDGAEVSATGLSLVQVSNSYTAADGAVAAVPARLRGHLEPPVLGASVLLRVGQAADPSDYVARSTLMSRADVCRHITLTSGRCARAPFEVVLSQGALDYLGLHVGSMVPLGDNVLDSPPKPMRVVGTYRPLRTDTAYWFDREVVLPPGSRDVSDQEMPHLDAALTVPATFAKVRYDAISSYADFALRRATVDVDEADAVQADIQRVRARLAVTGDRTDTALPALLDRLTSTRRQVGLVIPLVAAQLSLLGAVVLALVAAAATEQRRPEIALARLRGQGRRGAAGLMLRELGLLVVLGVPVGLLAGGALARLVVSRWMSAGVQVEPLRLPVVAAAVAAAAVGVAAVLFAAWPTLSQPVTSLLRRVPPRSAGLRLGIAEVVLATLAVAGVVAVVTGEGTGPLALVTPGLLALAVGLLVAQAVVPLTRVVGRVALRRGAVPLGLSALQVSRRPALRRVISIVTVGCALLVFSVDAWVVAARNREARAEVQAGAPVVLSVTAEGADSLAAAVRAADPGGRYATAVAFSGSPDPDGPVTVAVDPARIAAVASWGGAANRPSVHQLDRLASHGPALPRLVGNRVAFDASVVGLVNQIEEEIPAGELGPDRLPGTRMVRAANPTVRLVLELSKGDGHIASATSGPLTGHRATTVAPVDCGTGCRLLRIRVDTDATSQMQVQGTARIDGLRVGTGSATTPVDLGGAAAWAGVPAYDGSQSAVPSAGGALSIGISLRGAGTSVQHRGVPLVQPALAALDGPVEATAQAPGLDGQQRTYRTAGAIPLLPRLGRGGVLVDYDQAALGTGPTGDLTTFSVWLQRDDPARERALVAALGRAGVPVIGRDSTAARLAVLDRSGPVLALRMALIAAGAALGIAVLVLVLAVATSARSRAYDLAALRISGVGAATLRRASVLEQVGVALGGVVLGGASGIAGVAAVLHLVPMFSDPLPVPRLDLSTAWGTVGAVAGGALVLLAVTSALLGADLVRRAAPALVREVQR